MKSSKIREEVEAFQIKTAYSAATEDCFPAWYLHRKYFLPETQALTQCSDPAIDGDTKGYDFGLDAYHILRQDGRVRLFLLQAKYSGSISEVKKGFRDLKKLPARLRRLLDGLESDESKENKIIVNLRRDLNLLSPEERKSLILDFMVLHLCQEDHEIASNETNHSRSELGDQIEEELPDYTFNLGHIGPDKMDFGDIDTKIPPPWVPLELTVAETTAHHNNTEAQMLYGIAKLAELVAMYSLRRDTLFSKNVRYFIKNAKNTERGPSAKIRETLAQMCIKGTIDPGLFAFFHNGVTVFARAIRKNGNRIEIQDPYVLNGCQTIKTAYLFSMDPKIKDKLQQDKWAQVTIPLRITTTRDENLVQTITINNNRQNAIPPAALRANNPLQLELERRFRSRKIFYERQEGSFAHILDSNPETLIEDYENSNDLAIHIVELARSIAAAQGEEGLSYALHPNDIFEHDGTYHKVFNNRTTASTIFLTFLQNTHDMIFLVLKRDLRLEKIGNGPSPSRVGYHAIALLVRHLAKSNKHDFVLRFGQERLGKKAADFREELRKELGNHRSGIQTALKEHLLSAPDSRAETLRESYSAAERSLRLRGNIDPFATFANLDEEINTSQPT
ncbi:AIPR family protein [Archangium violaceum]|uniref:AIPR family protein n=1 Tax=Archangium violaceum TaxID=83451 RepID=UPI000A06D93D|nr:AIPR family protein [Archangium violaceum]